MKFIFFSLVFIFFSGMGLYAQSIPEMVAGNIANKMKDSLDLSVEQRAHIYSINLKLHERKKNARNNNASTISLQKRMQQIENTRDSLYQPVLSEEQYLLYKQKKSNLINNN